MRCDEIIDLLPLLVYDELSAEEAATCRQHLEACPTCAAELSSLRQVHGVLDHASQQQVQIDLAAVCLRIVAREHRQRIGRRVALGGAAVAAALLVVVSLRLLNIAVEPGRVTLAWSGGAWQPTPAASPLDDAPSPTKNPARDASSIIATPPTAEATATARAMYQDRSQIYSESDFEAALLTGLATRRNISPGQAEALRYAQPLNSQGFPQPAAANYHDLRLELLTPHDKLLPRPEAPGA
ncbi:MAG TPA: anti-sigma factor [Pirellulales bacterium]|nr:anti-sigma factor [Pirellulales bacterium]